MNIKIHSFGTPESQDLRNILEGMYRKMGQIESVGFPTEHTIELVIATDLNLEYEYGLHRMTRISPRQDGQRLHTSFVMVEIDGQTREEVVATYTFYPKNSAENHLTGRYTTDLFGVLNGRPLGVMKMKMKMKRLENAYA